MAIILSRFVPLHTGVLMLLLNIPLLILGGVVFGRRFLFSTVHGAVMLSVFTDLIGYICGRFGAAGATQDLFLASVFGGLLTAVGRDWFSGATARPAGWISWSDCCMQNWVTSA